MEINNEWLLKSCTDKGLAGLKPQNFHQILAFIHQHATWLSLILGDCIVHDGSNIHDTISGLFRIWGLKNHFPATMHQYAAGIVKLELNLHSAPPTQLSQSLSTHEGDQSGLRDLGCYLNELRSTQNQKWRDLHIDIGRHSKQVKLSYAILWHACSSRDVVKA